MKTLRALILTVFVAAFAAPSLAQTLAAGPVITYIAVNQGNKFWITYQHDTSGVGDSSLTAQEWATLKTTNVLNSLTIAYAIKYYPAYLNSAGNLAYGTGVDTFGSTPVSGNVAISGVSAQDGQLLIGSSFGGLFNPKTLTGGTGMTVTNGPGSITLSSFTSKTLHLKADTATTGQALIGSPLQFSFAGNGAQSFDAYLQTSSSSAAGIKLGLRFPSTDTLLAFTIGTDTVLTTGHSVWSAVTADSGLTSAYTTLNGTGYIHLHGEINGPTTGNVIVGFLKVTSGTATIKKNSYLEVWKEY